VIENSKREILSLLKNVFSDTPVVVPLADTVRIMNDLGRTENELYVLGSMGMPLSIATGVAKGFQDQGVNKKCVCIEGDGGLLLNFNSILTAQFLDLKNLIIVVLDNEQYGATGCQPTYTSKLDLVNIAKEVGYKCHSFSIESSTDDIKDTLIDAIDDPENSYFINIKITKSHETAPFFYDNPVILMHEFQEFIYKLKIL